MPNDPVQKTFVNVGLTGGVNKKRDAHQLRNGELLSANNVIFTNIDGQICKRNGFASVQPQGAAFQGGPFKAVGCRDNIEPLILGQNTLNRYNSNQNLSTSIPAPTQGRLEVSQVQGSSGKTTFVWPPSHATMATDGTQYACIAWAEPNATGSYMFYGVQDLQTGAWIISPRTFASSVGTYAGLGGTATSNSQMEPLVRYANGYFFLYYIWTGQYVSNSTTYYNAVLMVATLPLTNLAGGLTQNSWTAEFITQSTTFTAQSPTAISYDVHFSGNNFIVTTAGNSADSQLSQGVGISAWIGTISGTTLTTNKKVNFTPSNTSPGYKVACRCDGPSGTPYAVAVSGQICTISSAATSYTFNKYNAASDQNAPSITDCIWQGSNLVWFSTRGSGLNLFVSAITVNTSCALVSRIDGKLPVNAAFNEILSKAFVSSTANKIYIWAGQGGPSSDTVYNNAYLMEFDTSALTGSTIARTLYLSNYHITYGDKLRPTDVLQIYTKDASNNYVATQRYFTMLTSGQEKAANTSAWRAYGTLNRVLFDFAPARQVQIVSLPTGGNLIAGGYPLYYDGNDLVEAGFSNPPTADGVVASQWALATYAPVVASYSGGLVGGTSAVTPSGYIEYYYVICFVRRDAYGNVYRSSPSPSITVPCSNASNSVAFSAYTANAGGNVQIEYYRSTQGTPGTYYKLATVPNGSAWTDYQPDGSTAPNNNTSITKNPTVYTNSNELANDPPPAVHHMVCSESRAYLIPADNRNVVWYSKQFSPGRTVEFSAALTLSEGLNSGQFSGLAVLDANLIVFKNDAILYTYGNGPDNGGANGSFAPFQKIASDVGCIDPGSIAVIPNGVVFRSRRGIELLTRGLQVQYIGGPVENLVATNGALSSVVCMPNFAELRFVPATANNTGVYNGTAGTGPTSLLTYDYMGNRWSTQSNMAAVQAVNINNDYWFISADGTLVNKETPGVYLDNGTAIKMTIETPEIPCGSGGAQGWGRIYRMALLGDFFSAHQLQVSFAYDHQLAYTNMVTFNTTSGLISGDAVYQFRCSRLPRQVMQTLKLKIEDTGTTGQSCAISSLALEVGSKNGLAKLPPAKTL